MRPALRRILLLTACFMGFTAYCYALIDWLQDYNSDYYAYHRVEQVLETTAILVTYLGVRFYQKRMDFLP